jgi:hypothetical protein
MYLRAQISVLLLNELDFSSKISEFKKALKRKFNSDYSEELIAEEVEFLNIENQVMMSGLNEVIEIPEDFELQW